MTSKFCKELLESKQSGIYTIIIENFTEEIFEFGPTVFRKWLSREIGIEEQKISVSSLNSALARFKKSQTKIKTEGKKLKNISIQSTLKSSNEGFKFSKIDDVKSQPLTVEM